jgi:hypothetical protein
MTAHEQLTRLMLLHELVRGANGDNTPAVYCHSAIVENRARRVHCDDSGLGQQKIDHDWLRMPLFAR